MEQRLEDGELGLEGGGVAGAQRGAMGGVVVVLQARGREGGEAWSATTVHGVGWGGGLVTRGRYET